MNFINCSTDDLVDELQKRLELRYGNRYKVKIAYQASVVCFTNIPPAFGADPYNWCTLTDPKNVIFR